MAEPDKTKLKGWRNFISLRQVLVIAVGVISVVVYAAFIWKEHAPVVEVTTGKVRGVVSMSRRGREFYEYFSIPYAQPPVGALRFASPQPPSNWTGIRDGSQEPPFCLQIDLLPRLRKGQEDCLYLNVFVPKNLGFRKSLPVMVFFHGGGFTSGGMENFGSHFFMDEDIVLVTLHYRLGVFGFLNAEDVGARGNQGLKDQVMALKWVQENIAKFGGNPKKVTIFGESAGSASVHFHILSPMSKGLFHRGISQSATSLMFYIFNKSTRKQNQLLANSTNCPLIPTKEFLSCLRNKDATELAELHRFLEDPPRDPDLMFIPSLEMIQDSEAFLIEEPRKLLENGTFNRVPWISGVNADEGLLFTSELLIAVPAQLRGIVQDWTKLREYLHVPNTTFLEEVRAFYFPKSYDFHQMTTPKSIAPLTDMFSDRYFFTSNHAAARLQSQFSPVYLYHLTHESQISMVDVMRAVRAEGSYMVLEFIILFARDFFWRLLDWDPRFPGISHAEELLLQFSVLPLPHVSKPSPTSPDYLMSSQMISTWAQFAHDETSMTFCDVPWNPINPQDEVPMYMNLNVTNPMMLPEPFHDRVKFWITNGIY